MKNKIDFIVAGTQKGGTTALYQYLNDHDDICMSRKQEAHFFDNDKYFINPYITKLMYYKYHSYFRKKSENQLLGEGTPIYMYWYDTPKRLWEYNPNIKIIITLRNPIERAYSQWNMSRMKNKDSLSFWDAIQQEDERKREALPKQHRVYSYIDRGFYSEQLKRIWHFFPKEQTLIVKNEDLKNKPYETLKQIYDFLGVSMPQDIAIKNANTRPYSSPLSLKEFEYLKDIFSTEITILEKLLNWDCSQWLEYPTKEEEINSKKNER